VKRPGAAAFHKNLRPATKVSDADARRYLDQFQARWRARTKRGR
jgi:hypothetical protein